MAELKPVKAKPSFYAHCYYPLQEIARNMGYNLLIHGSMNRDMDLVAVAWSNETKSHIELLESFCDYLGIPKFVEDNPERKKLLYQFSLLPGDRSSYVLNLARGGYYNNYTDTQYYLDISFTPIFNNYGN